MIPIRFEHLRAADVPLLETWFQQDYIAKYWHGEGLANTRASVEAFTTGKACPYTLWFAYDEKTPFGYLMTSEVNEDEAFFRKHLPDRATAVTIDLLIGNTAYLGKGLAHVMIQQLLLQKYAGVEYAFIDPGSTNEKAIHVYKKAGFETVDRFEPSWELGTECLLMRLDLSGLKNQK